MTQFFIIALTSYIISEQIISNDNLMDKISQMARGVLYFPVSFFNVSFLSHFTLINRHKQIESAEFYLTFDILSTYVRRLDTFYRFVCHFVQRRQYL